MAGKLDVHDQILQEVRTDIHFKQAQIERLQAELDELRSVEKYHSGKIGNASPTNYVAGNHKPAIAKGRFDGMTKHDAIAAVLTELRRPLKTREIDDILVKSGFGADLDEKVRVNGLYLALSRKEDMFEKIGKGLWTLKEKAD